MVEVVKLTDVTKQRRENSNCNSIFVYFLGWKTVEKILPCFFVIGYLSVYEF